VVCVDLLIFFCIVLSQAMNEDSFVVRFYSYIL